MDVAQQYAQQCSELYEADGFAAVRRTAQAGLDQLGPTPVLYRWLGLAHAAEDEDDHDAEAERAYRAGLAAAPDDLGLLVSYLELCLRTDAFDHPARAGRVTGLRARIDERAPAGSPEREHIDHVFSRAGRGYWDDLMVNSAQIELRKAETAELSDRVATALRVDTTAVAPSPASGEDVREAEVAAALDLLQGRANAPMRFLLTHRPAAYASTFVAALVTNRVLTMTGVADFSLWGYLLYLPLVAADAKLRSAQRLARQRVVARIEERHALQAAAVSGAADHPQP